MVPEPAIVRHVHIGHQDALGPKRGHPAALYRPAIDGDIFTNHVVVAEHDFRRLSTIAEVLRRAADRGKGMHLIALADLGPSVDGDMG